jgi:hypothetical protein
MEVLRQQPEAGERIWGIPESRCGILSSRMCRSELVRWSSKADEISQILSEAMISKVRNSLCAL